MFEFLISVFSSFDDCNLFFYVPCCALVCGLIALVLSFTKRGIVL